MKFEDATEDDQPNAKRSRRAGGNELQAIFKVSEGGYVPDGVDVRAKIDETMFTGNFPASLEARLRGDEKVVSIALNERLQKID